MNNKTTKKILAIAAHPDDIEYGCFGTLKRHQNNKDNILYLCLTFGGDSGDWEKRKKEQEYTASLIGAKVRFSGLQSAYLNNDSGRKTIKSIEKTINVFKPDVIYSHSYNDRHQDHRLVNKATISACRFFTGELYFYEGFSSLKYFKPNIVHKIDRFFSQKIEILGKFLTQQDKFYMNPKVIESISVFRAAQFGFLGKAEAFEVGGIVR